MLIDEIMYSVRFVQKEYIILSKNVSIQCFGNMKVFKGSTT